MNNFHRDILILLKDQRSQQAIEQEIESLNGILLTTESQEQFCTAHELVTRNRITSKSTKILRSIRYSQMKPFQFLICKN
ncbi:MAG: hypothetical protein ABUT20_09500 [Bacteroidota bacterium]